ncbi:Panacea domain-containing protein [Eggerthellaceae bacterium 3-80]|nr:DUF4065 domain-containing protein [bacterium D16-34]
MANVITVATYALHKLGCTSTMKLQKVVFYSQAYHLVEHQEPLFEEEIQAWINGPVVSELFQTHKGQFVIDDSYLDERCPEAEQELTDEERASIDHVVNILNNFTGVQLSELTHNEDPWQQARGNCAPNIHSKAPISRDSIYGYYSSPQCSNPVFASK